MSVRDMVKELQVKLLIEATSSDGDTMRYIGNKAAALLGSVNAAQLEAEILFNAVHAAHMREHSAAKAKVFAEATPEYKRLREAENAHEELKAICKATDNALRNLSFEMHLTR